MATNELQILCWNVQGLNSIARRSTVQQVLATTHCQIVCLQETKMTSIDDQLVMSVGGFRLNSFTFLPAGGPSGTRGGILILWNKDEVDLDYTIKRAFSISTTIKIKATTVPFLLTTVYGPTQDRDKLEFLHEL